MRYQHAKYKDMELANLPMPLLVRKHGEPNRIHIMSYSTAGALIATPAFSDKQFSVADLVKQEYVWSLPGVTQWCWFSMECIKGSWTTRSVAEFPAQFDASYLEERWVVECQDKELKPLLVRGKRTHRLANAFQFTKDTSLNALHRFMQQVRVDYKVQHSRATPSMPDGKSQLVIVRELAGGRSCDITANLGDWVVSYGLGDVEVVPVLDTLYDIV